MKDEALRKYIVIIRIGEALPSRERVLEAAPKIRDTIERLSNKDCRNVFTTPDGSTFAFFLRTKFHSRIIRNALTGNDSGFGYSISILRNDDALIISELGDDFDGMGFSRAWSWLQHR